MDNLRCRGYSVLGTPSSFLATNLTHLCLPLPKRTAWLPYFDNVNAIIFLAPISCFDESLDEDPRINRLRDSFLLWQAICASELLQNTTLIVFLNKCDVLEKKLKAGIKVNKYIPSFADRPNETETVVKCEVLRSTCSSSRSSLLFHILDLSKKFQATLRDSSPTPRMCYIYPTSVVVC
jgi:hypothetical protein